MPVELNNTLKQELLIEFEQLETLEEKLEFWRKKLKKEYIFYLITVSLCSDRLTPQEQKMEQEFICFRILPKHPKEILHYNETILEEYKFCIDQIAINKKVFDFDIYVSEFDVKLEAVANKKEFIDFEIKKTKDLISDLEKKRSMIVGDMRHDFFKSSFNSYYFKSVPVDLSKSPWDIYNLIEINNAKVLAEYLKYLHETLENIAQKKVAKKPLNIEQKFLELDYMGVMSKINSVKLEKRKNQFLASLLGVHEQTIKETLLNYHRLKTASTKSEKDKVRKNLKRVELEFEELGLQSIVKLVRADLKKLDQ